MMNLVWLKRDLRISDHRPLEEACATGPTVALYVYEPDLIRSDEFDASHLTFINESLRDLERDIHERGGALLRLCGDVVDALQLLHHRWQITTLWSHEETGTRRTYRRDLRVKDACEALGIRWREYPQNGVVRGPHDRNGWAKHWAKIMSQQPPPAPGSWYVPGDVMRDIEVLDCGERQAHDFGIPRSQRTDVQRGGRDAAHATLASFLDWRGANYRSDMSSPVEGTLGCSRVSPYLAWGNLSVREVYQATRQRRAELRALREAGTPIPGNWQKSLSSFEGRLRWHCHFIQKFEDEPEIEFSNMNRGFDGMREDDYKREHFDAWLAGQTGYPMVDACMRSLHATGWVNFRMRAMLVSFASYHLWLHWRTTATALARLFLDFEPGIHFSQVQMQSGVTGINTVRIYSPTKQVLDQDPRGTFIRRYVPELASVPDAYLAEPHLMPPLEAAACGFRPGEDYPAPIVEHKAAYKEAKSRVYTWKGREETRMESQKVYDKHGSRRRPRSPRRGRAQANADS